MLLRISASKTSYAENSNDEAHHFDICSDVRFLPGTKVTSKGRPPIFDSPVTRYAPEETLAYEKVIERIIASSLSWMQIKRHFPCDPGLEALLRSRGKNANSDAIVGIGIVSAYYC